MNTILNLFKKLMQFPQVDLGYEIAGPHLDEWMTSPGFHRPYKFNLGNRYGSHSPHASPNAMSDAKYFYHRDESIIYRAY